ncbi:hypothetical protein [Phaeobacter italicus]|jgi:hypothetical protein|uniref:hypothetical protein n=1 Tax=Phaeobacter italicus TaxID=481446 RepID=UPI002FDD3623
MTEEELQVQRCIIAIHDLGTREGATKTKVMAQLKKDGFTARQIKKAVELME